MALLNRDRIWLGVGLIRDRRGIFIYEVQEDTYRILARAAGEEEAERLVRLINQKKIAFERDLSDNHFSNCCEGREAHAE